MRPSGLRIHSALFIVALIYASTPTLAKFLMPAYIQPVGFILLRIIGALVLIYAYHAWRVKEKLQSTRDYLLMIVCAFFGVGVNMVFFFEGVARTSPIDSLLIMVTTPILVLVIGFFLRLEKITLPKALGISLGTLGAMLLITGAGAGSEGGNFLGNIFILINAASYAVYLVLIKPLSQKYHPMTILLWTFLFGAVMVSPLGLMELMQAKWQGMGPALLADMAYIIVATTFITYAFNGWAMQYVNPSVVGSYIYLQPVLGTLIALAIGKYTLHWLEAFYALLIFAGVYLIQVRDTGFRLRRPFNFGQKIISSPDTKQSRKTVQKV